MSGWHEGITTPYLAALSGLKHALAREMDAVQVGNPPLDRLSEAWFEVVARRVDYRTHLLEHDEKDTPT